VVNDASAANKAARWVAQACLYLSLDLGLRLLHPLMPFVTEDLWQRLPGRGAMGEPQSIMLNPYPTEVRVLDSTPCSRHVWYVYVRVGDEQVS
jgi:valyl-tRNA synthetase